MYLLPETSNEPDWSEWSKWSERTWKNSKEQQQELELSSILLTHNFLEYYCILNCVSSLSDHSLNVVDKDVKIEARELPNILGPFLSFNVSFRLLKLEKIEPWRQISDTSMREDAEHFEIQITLFVKQCVVFRWNIQILYASKEVRVISPRLKNLKPYLSYVTNSIRSEPYPGRGHVAIILEIVRCQFEHTFQILVEAHFDGYK